MVADSALVGLYGRNNVEHLSHPAFRGTQRFRSGLEELLRKWGVVK